MDRMQVSGLMWLMRNDAVAADVYCILGFRV